MFAGMALVLTGLASALYGLTPPSLPDAAPRARSIRVRALDDAPIRAAHVGLLVVNAIAVTIDVMKPTSLSFVLPGMAREYGLLSPVNPTGRVPAALLPLSGITGTVLGSFMVAESIPARHRGWLMVLIGGDVAGAYIISSTLGTRP